MEEETNAAVDNNVHSHSAHSAEKHPLPHTEECTPATRSAKKPIGFHLSIFAIFMFEFIYSLDATTLAVAVPAIAEDVGGTTLQAFWASISYLLAVSVIQPVYTVFSDAIGRTGPLYVAFVLFITGSIVFATAGDMNTVIAGRVLQGLGGGGMNILGEILLTDMTTLQERAFYGGLMAIPTAAGSILGPTIGAVFSDLVSWRWIGWINLPFMGISVPLIVIFLRIKRMEGSLLEKLRGLDWIGMALFVSGCTVFVVAISWADALYPWSSYQTILPLVLGTVVLAVFIVYESRPAAPLLPHRIFKSWTASLTLFSSFIHGMLVFPLLFYLPLLYESVALRSRLTTAVALLPTSFVSVLSALIASIAVSIVGGYRWWIWIFWTFAILGAGLLCLIDENTSIHGLRGLPIVWGIGIGGLLRLSFLPVQASLENVDDTGVAVLFTIESRTLGGLVGLAIGSTVFSSTFAKFITSIQALPEAATAGLPSASQAAVGFIPQLLHLDLSQASLDLLRRAYLESIHTIFYVMIGLGGLAFLSILFIKELSLQKTEKSRQHFEVEEGTAEESAA